MNGLNADDASIGTKQEYPALCVHELFERQAARSPDATAVVFGAQRLGYRQLNELANRLAHHLRERGVGPDSLVGVGMKRSPLMVVALLAVWKAGGAYVPLDPGYPAERLSFMLGDAGLRLLLTDESSCRLFRAAAAELGARTIDDIRLDADWPRIAAERADNPGAAATPAHLAYVMYTSGSTGKPKGAMITHAGLVNYLCWAIDAYGVAAGGSVPVHSSLSFDLTVTSLYPPLLAGAEVELLAEDDGAQNLLAALRAKKRSLVKITPAHLELLNRQLSAGELAGLTDVFVIGGEDLRGEYVSSWRQHAPATRLINEYGPTETVVGCCVHEVNALDPAKGSLPIGRPIANTRLHVLDADMKPAPRGAAGELYIGGAGVARGYLNRPELTKERFLPDPFSDDPGARLYKTGDMARVRGDGVLEYLGRLDNQVKIRGYRIELGEIEQALASHPDVHACAVLAHGESLEERRLVGFVVTSSGGPLRTRELLEFLKRRLPAHMVPVRLIQLDTFPLTPNGKLNREALQAMARIEAPAAGQGKATNPTPPAAVHALPAREAPRTPTEEVVLGVFRDIFQNSDIGVFDSFFDLGGHSLMAVRLMSKLRGAVGINVPLRNLYERPTVAGLAEAIDAYAWSAETAAKAAAVEEKADERMEITL